MSWFTDIAGKAEDLLNKVDKSAATALKNKTKSVSDVRLKSEQRHAEAYKSTLAITSSGGHNYNSGYKNESFKNYKRTPQKKKAESDDEKLLQFLNSPEPVSTPTVKRMPLKSPPTKTETSPDDVGIDIDTVDSSNATDTERTDSDTHNEPNFVTDETLVTNVEEDHGSELHSVSVDVNESENPTGFAPPKEEEIALYKKQAEVAESEMKRMRKKLEHYNHQISGNDRLVRDLQEHENDLTAALNAKDSQLAVLKVRLEEADNDVLSKKKTIEDLKTENERLSKCQKESTVSHNQSIENLREKLMQAEAEYSKINELYRNAQTEHLTRMSKLEEEKRHLAENVTNLQRKCSEVNDRMTDSLVQVHAANRNLQTLQQEYADYKQKAQRILQSKEKLILSLKEGNSEDEWPSSENSLASLSVETEGIQQERDLLRDELRRANELLDATRNELQELEKLAETDAESAREHQKSLKEHLQQERRYKEETQLENNQLKEEMQFLRDDFQRAQNNFQMRIQDREMEIEKLRKQLTAKSLSTVSQDELESRLHALTENLIQKQTIVEALSTEKNSLVLQLERMEQQFKEAQMYGSQNHASVGINHPQSERKLKPPLFLENPFDSHLTRRVKNVYGSIDAFSIRMGVFFRRYPVARLFIFLYMLLLHLWVMIVLLTYEPEVHSTSFKGVNNEKE